MSMRLKRIVFISSVLLSATTLTLPAFAEDAMLSTGGYARQLNKMEMMKMLDANGDHMVTAAEADAYYNSIFDALDKDKNDSLDAKEWVGTTGKSKLELATGGYSRELRSMKMMKMMDADGDHLVTRDEFLTHHKKIFENMDKSGDHQLDPQEWLAKQTGN